MEKEEFNAIRVGPLNQQLMSLVFTQAYLVLFQGELVVNGGTST